MSYPLSPNIAVGGRPASYACKYPVGLVADLQRTLDARVSKLDRF